MEPVIFCPNCNEPVIIQELNCGIFRHGILKSNYQQMDPHTPKDICIYLKKYDKILGCGKPFQVLIENNQVIIKRCDYI